MQAIIGRHYEAGCGGTGSLSMSPAALLPGQSSGGLRTRRQALCAGLGAVISLGKAENTTRTRTEFRPLKMREGAPKEKGGEQSTNGHENCTEGRVAHQCDYQQ